MAYCPVGRGLRGSGFAALLPLLLLTSPSRAQTPPPSAPPAPTGLTATAGNNQVTLYWTPVSGAGITYSVYVATIAGGEGTTPTAGNITPASYGVAGTANGTTYYFEVTATSGGQESAKSAEVSATPAVGVPAPPAQFAVTPGDAQASLKWQAVSTAASYKVYKATAAAGPFTQIGGPTGTSFTSTGLTNGASYWYYVTATSSYGDSAASPTRNIVANPPPAAPTGIQATSTTTTVSLTWNASVNAVSYNVYRSTGDLNFTLVGSPTTTSYTDSTVAAATDYWYEVTAVGANGASSNAIGTEVTTTTQSTSQNQTCGTAPPAGYAYVDQVQTAMPAIGGITVSDISLPSAIKLTWAGYSHPNPSPACSYYFTWTRSGGSGASGTTGIDSLRDTSFPWGTALTYTVTAKGNSDWGTHTDAQGNLWYDQITYTDSPPTSITVTAQQLTVADNGTVDARYDLRYGNPTYLNFPFGNVTYNGGLFVGNSSDNSRMSRSFFRFNPTGVRSGIWAGSTNVYLMTAAAGFSSATIGMQGVPDNGWTPATLNWSTAPFISPSAASRTVSVANYTGGFSAWCRWPLDGASISLTGAGAVTPAMAVTTESADANAGVMSWLYFNKKENNSTVPPTLVYATGAPLGVFAVEVSPNSVKGGTSSTGTAYLNGPAPTGGLVVGLSSSDTHATVPATVTVPAGATSAPFTITTTTVLANVSATITASYTFAATTTLTITP